MKKKSIKLNFLYNLWVQILNIVLPLITAPYVTRVLGANLLGVYSKTHAVANYFYLFTLLGLSSYGNRAIAQVRDSRADTSRTFWEIYTSQFVCSLAVVALYICYTVTVGGENSIVYIFQGLYVLSGLFDISWFCCGMEEFRLTSVRTTVTRVVSAALVFAFVRSKDDFLLYTLILSGNFIVSALALWPFLLRKIEFVKPTWDGIKKHIKPNLVLFSSIIAVSLYNIMDKVLLGFFSTNEEVAIYTYAERIVVLPTTLIFALSNVVMPRMSNIFAKGDRETANRYMTYVMLFSMFLSTAMAFGLGGVSNVFAPWFYGMEFQKCGLYILLLSPTVLFRAYAGALRTQYIIPTGKDNIYVLAHTVGGVVNLVLDCALIPFFDGVGAIIGTVAAEFVVAYIHFVKCRKEIPIKDYCHDAIAFCIIGLLMLIPVEAIECIKLGALATMLLQMSVGAVFYCLIGSFYMIKIKKEPKIVNEALKMLRIPLQFKSIGQ